MNNLNNIKNIKMKKKFFYEKNFINNSKIKIIIFFILY